ncbi:MAG: GtrA family protein [Hyphomicrobiaceae bacterium]
MSGVREAMQGAGAMPPVDALAALRRTTARVRNFVTAPGRVVQFARYTAVSGASLLVDLGTFWGLLNLSLTGPALAGALSCMAGLLLHYGLARSCVFDGSATGKSQARLASEYLLTGVMGFAITAGSIQLAMAVFGLPAPVAKGIGIALTFVSVYLVRAGVVYAPAALAHR